MKYKVFDGETFKKTTWSGGKTTELAIYPKDSDYGKRDFVFRLSSATIEEDADFSHLAEYDRWLMVLEGEIVLSYDDRKTVSIKPFEWDAFDGGIKSRSFGKATDYNLMLKKGNKGEIKALKLKESRTEIEVNVHKEYEKAFAGIYIKGEYAVVTLNDKSLMVRDSEQLLIEFDREEEISLGIMGKGMAIVTQGSFNDEKRPESEILKEDLKKEKTEDEREDGGLERETTVTGSDFKWARKLYFNSFRFSKYISKFDKEYWIDDRLKESLKKINRFFITFAVFLLGLVGAMIVGMDKYVGIWILCWILLDMLVLNPLIYVLWLPKPISKHIKRRSDMTEADNAEEIRRGEEEIDKLMKRFPTAEDWIEKRRK